MFAPYLLHRLKNAVRKALEQMGSGEQEFSKSF
jgi:hypothetical protein